MTNGHTTQNKPAALTRQLGLFDTIMLYVGIVLGSGIFLTTGLMAQALPSVWLILAAWIVGGLLTLAGSLIFAELGASLPEAGGQYVYLREAYGPLAGFLFGWVSFTVYISGAIAGLSAAFAEYLSYFFPSLSFHILSSSVGAFGFSLPVTISWGQLVGVLVILLLSAANYAGVSWGKFIQNVFTIIKVTSLLALIVAGFLLAKEPIARWALNPQELSFGQLLSGFGLALVAVGWAFDGWTNVSFISGEIKDPQRNFPRALIVGTLTITVLYLLVNIVYFLALPLDEMTGVIRVAEKAGTALFGGSATAMLAVAVLISTFGALNGTILVGPRIYFAMARDNLFFKKAANVHPRFRTPGAAIILQATWACVLTLSGTFEQLLTFVMFVSILFWVAGAASLFTLRKKRPDLPRPFKTWGYPVVPLLFIAASVGILLNTLLEKPVESLAGLALTALGIPLYLYWKRSKPASSVQPS